MSERERPRERKEIIECYRSHLFYCYNKHSQQPFITEKKREHNSSATSIVTTFIRVAHYHMYMYTYD